MSGKLQFREKLNGILALGKEKQYVLTMEDVEKYFEEDVLSEEQVELVCDYLLSQKIAVTGYVKKGGTVVEKEERTFSEADERYLDTYMEEMASLIPINEREEKLKEYYQTIVEIAKELYTPTFFIGDLIQEGNVGLVLALEKEETTEKEIIEEIRQMMQLFVEEQEEMMHQDNKMVEKVVFLDESLKNLTEDLERKPTLEELADYMEMTEEEVDDILRLTGEDDDEEEEQ
ncbi:RNA polymerase sigma factor region1.1 domain-containing protein [Faecalimonas sp.]